MVCWHSIAGEHVDIADTEPAHRPIQIDLIFVKVMREFFASIPEMPWYVGASLIVALFALWISFRNYRIGAGKAKIERDRALGRNLSLIVYSARITGYGKFEWPRNYILCCHTIPKGPLAFPFIAEVENLGTKTAANVQLFLRFPRILRGDRGAAPNAHAGHVVTPDEDVVIVRFDLGECHPGEKIPVLDYLDIREEAFPSGVAAFRVDFRVAQRDEVSEEGQLIMGLMDGSRRTAPDALSELSALVPVVSEPRRWTLGESIADAFWVIADRTMTIGRLILLVTYEKDSAVPDKAIGGKGVPARAMKVKVGVRDRRGRLLFPGLNSGKAMLFHGMHAPEIGGVDGNEVANLGVRKIGSGGRRL